MLLISLFLLLVYKMQSGGLLINQVDQSLTALLNLIAIWL